MKPCHRNPTQERDRIGPDRIRFNRINTSRQTSELALKSKSRSDSTLQLSGFKFQASDSSCQTLRFPTQDFRLQPQQGASIMVAVAPCFVTRLQTNMILKRQQWNLGEDEISIPFFQTCAEWNTNDGADGADGAPEMQPQAAIWSLVPHAPGVRIT